MSPARDRRRGNGEIPDEDAELKELLRQPRKPPIRKESRRRESTG